MPLNRFFAALLGILLAGSAALLGNPAPANAAGPTAGTVTLDISTATSLLSPGQDLLTTVTITNGSDESLSVGSVNVFLAGRALTTQDALGDWLSSSNAGGSGDLLQTATTRGEILPGNATTLQIAVPAASVGLTAANAWGARGIAATFQAGGAVVAEGRGTFVWYTEEAPQRVSVALAMPLTTPAGSSGLIPAAALETFTGENGLLTRQLEGVLNKEVAIAIDPMIIASIRVLGNAAPRSAVAWLDTLSQATNDIFPLSYADADISLQAQSGVGTLLAPISFDQAIDPSLFTEPEPEGTATPGGTPSATPAPTPPAGEEVTPPTMEELLAWDYTATDIGWPAEGHVAAEDLGVFAASGLTTTILSGSQLVPEDEDSVGNAAVMIGEHAGLAIDDDLSSAIRRAATATSDQEWASALAEATSYLAVVSAGSDSRSTSTVLAAFDRGWPPTAARLSQTLNALSAIPWAVPTSLGDVSSAKPTADAPAPAFKAGSESESRLASARTLLQREREITAFSSALANPVTVTAAHRLDLLALYATAWTADPGAWQDAVSKSLVASGELLESVSVTTKGPINVLATQVDIPVTLRNAFEQAVTVRVQLVPSNGRLVVGEDVEATIDADSARTIKVPVSAKVGNGDVTLRVSVYSPTGIPVGEPGFVEVNVQAEWEGLGAAIFAVLVVLFFGFGVWRNIVRRRRERTGDLLSTSAATGTGSASGTGSTNEPGAPTATGSTSVDTPRG
jgi:hypothetical protein